MRILLVEDDEFDAQLVSRRLTRAGLGEVRVDHVPTVAGAVQCASEQRYDVMLLDLALPDATGTDVLVAMRSYRAPKIVLTGNADLEVALGALKHGAQDFLSKDDLSTASLGRSIRHALERHALQLRIRRSLERERVLRQLIEQLVLTDEAGKLIESAVRMLPELPGIESGAFYLRRGEHFQGINDKGKVHMADPEATPVFELILSGTDPVAPGAGPADLHHCWLVPVRHESLKFGILAAHSHSDLDAAAVQALLSTVARTMVVALRASRRTEELRLSASAAQKVAAFVPRGVLLEIGRNPHGNGRPAPRRKTAAVLAIELVDFGRQLDGQAADVVVESVNTRMGPIHEAIVAHGGRIERHSGQGAIAVFEATGDETDAAVAARALAAITTLLREQSEPPLRIGATVGPVVEGAIGSAHRTEFALVGQTMARAVAIRALAPAGGAAVDKTVDKHLKDAGGKQPAGVDLLFEGRDDHEVEPGRAPLRITVLKARD